MPGPGGVSLKPTQERTFGLDSYVLRTGIQPAPRAFPGVFPQAGSGRLGQAAAGHVENPKRQLTTTRVWATMAGAMLRLSS